MMTNKILDFESNAIPNRYDLLESGADKVAQLLTYEDALVLRSAYEMRAAMQEFVDRVDAGKVRSTKTYNKFKSIISKTISE